MSEPTSNPQSAADVAAAIRIIDANSNRALEGLRVVEDFLRFGLNDAFLSRTCKQLRHDLSETLKVLGAEQRFACRSTETDVGISSKTKTEYQRTSLQDVAMANLRRVAESLRTIEEYAKLTSTASAQRFESLRYRIYTLEKSIGHLCRSLRALAEAKLYALIDLRFGIGKDFQNRVRQLLDSGVDVIQLRDKQSSDRELVAAAKIVRQLVQDTGKPFIMNDRADIACAVGASGVHVGQEELTVADARRVVGADALVGVSTHSIEQARQAVLDGADYIGVGPVFPSSTKSFEEFVGLDLIRQVASEIGLPAFAIGGISEENLHSVVDAGLDRVAISGAIWLSADPGSKVQSLRATLGID